ncbi:MAG: hypothetical protein ABGX07_19975 [Pirellulaceae bacterium]
MPSSGPFDAIAATWWIHAILREKNLGDPELNERIRDLLLAAGYTKVVFHGDDEIRSLGEQAVLPLLAYLKSPQFKNQKPQRRRAASLTSDLAPMWAIGDLIGMLSDDDAEVAAICSRALVRLAGTNLGEPVEQWQDDLERRLAVQQRWREWWQLREAKMPKHPLRGVNNQAVEIQGLKNQGVKQ